MNDNEHVLIGIMHRHYKGGRYIPLGVVRNSEDRHQLLVVYVSLDRGSFWARPLRTPGMDSWTDVVTWPNGKPQVRFLPEYLLSVRDLKKLQGLWDKLAAEEKK